jgi:hypothetical protein
MSLKSHPSSGEFDQGVRVKLDGVRNAARADLRRAAAVLVHVQRIDRELAFCRAETLRQIAPHLVAPTAPPKRPLFGGKGLTIEPIDVNDVMQEQRQSLTSNELQTAGMAIKVRSDIRYIGIEAESVEKHFTVTRNPEWEVADQAAEQSSRALEADFWAIPNDCPEANVSFTLPRFRNGNLRGNGNQSQALP